MPEYLSPGVYVEEVPLDVRPIDGVDTPEWKYVNVRRLLIFVEESLGKGLQWAVFEPNGPALWAGVRTAVECFLMELWRSGALVGSKADEAFFVSCDLHTMSQNDIDSGRVIVVVGIAPLRPAEFVNFRLTIQTEGAADRKS